MGKTNPVTFDKTTMQQLVNDWRQLAAHNPRESARFQRLANQMSAILDNYTEPAKHRPRAMKRYEYLAKD